jgi:hypothetical protein
MALLHVIPHAALSSSEVKLGDNVTNVPKFLREKTNVNSSTSQGVAQGGAAALKAEHLQSHACTHDMLACIVKSPKD